MVVYTDETETKDRSLSVKKYFQKVSVLCTDKSFVWKVFDMYKENVYVHKECWFEYTQVKWKQTIEVCLYLSIKEVSVLCTDKICMYLERVWYVQRNIMYTKECYGTYTVREAHWFESNFTGNNAPFNTNGI